MQTNTYTLCDNISNSKKALMFINSDILNLPSILKDRKKQHLLFVSQFISSSVSSPFSCVHLSSSLYMGDTIDMLTHNLSAENIFHRHLNIYRQNKCELTFKSVWSPFLVLFIISSILWKENNRENFYSWKLLHNTVALWSICCLKSDTD